MANENQKKVLDNSALVEAINDMRKEFKPETQNKVINLALRATFLVPAIINKSTQLVADADNHVNFQEQPQVKFLLITHKERGTFFPVFTDGSELAKFKSEQKFQGFAMRFADIAALTERTPNTAGFVINPMNQSLPFTKAMLEAIKNTLAKAKKAREEAEQAKSGDEPSHPNITVTTNK